MPSSTRSVTRPTSTPSRPTKNSHVEDVLFNHRQFVKQWQNDPTQDFTQSCRCPSLAHLPPVAFLRQHVATDATKLQLESDLRTINSGSSKISVYPSRSHFISAFTESIQKWFWNDLNCIGAHTLLWDLSRFLRATCSSCANNSPGHSEDHAAHRIMLYCPIVYADTLAETWNKPEIFQSIPNVNILETHDDTVASIRTTFPQYAWALRLRTYFLCLHPPQAEEDVPIGQTYCILCRFFARRLFLALAFIIHLLVPVAFPQSLKHYDVWCMLTNSFSVITTRVSSTSSTTRTWRASSLQWTLLDFLLLVSIYARSNKPYGLSRGRCRKPAVNQHSIRCTDVPLILHAVLQLRDIRVGLHAFSQCRGSPTRNPASPALCLMTVAAVEQLWYDTFFRHSVIPYRLTLQLAFRNFLHAGFYVQPVNLVDEPGQDFLGFVINVNQRTIQFIPPSSTAQSLHPRGFTT